MSDENERSVASAGSVAGKPVAWIAVFDGDDADGEFVWPDKGRAIEWASTRPRVQIAPLYLRPQNAVVRLPPLDPNGAPGWNAAIGAVREALADAGVDWDTE